MDDRLNRSHSQDDHEYEETTVTGGRCSAKDCGCRAPHVAPFRISFSLIRRNLVSLVCVMVALSAVSYLFIEDRFPARISALFFENGLLDEIRSFAWFFSSTTFVYLTVVHGVYQELSSDLRPTLLRLSERLFSPENAKCALRMVAFRVPHSLLYVIYFMLIVVVSMAVSTAEDSVVRAAHSANAANVAKVSAANASALIATMTKFELDPMRIAADSLTIVDRAVADALDAAEEAEGAAIAVLENLFRGEPLWVLGISALFLVFLFLWAILSVSSPLRVPVMVMEFPDAKEQHVARDLELVSRGRALAVSSAAIVTLGGLVVVFVAVVLSALLIRRPGLLLFLLLLLGSSYSIFHAIVTSVCYWLVRKCE